MQANHMTPEQYKAYLAFKKEFLDVPPNEARIKRLSGKKTASKDYLPTEYVLGYMEDLFPFNDQRITHVHEVHEMREVWDKKTGKMVVKPIDVVTVGVEIHLHVYLNGEYVTTRVVSGVGEVIRYAGAHADIQKAKSYAIKNAMKCFVAFGKGLHERERYGQNTYAAQSAIAKKVPKN
jgi:hypothetical protein